MIAAGLISTDEEEGTRSIKLELRFTIIHFHYRLLCITTEVVIFLHHQHRPHPLLILKNLPTNTKKKKSSEKNHQILHQNIQGQTRSLTESVIHLKPVPPRPLIILLRRVLHPPTLSTDDELKPFTAAQKPSKNQPPPHQSIKPHLGIKVYINQTRKRKHNQSKTQRERENIKESKADRE